MKHVSGMIYLPPSLEALVTPSPSLLRKASLVIRREGLLPGKWPAATGLLQSVITGIIPGNRNSEYVSKLMSVTVLC